MTSLNLFSTPIMNATYNKNLTEVQFRAKGRRILELATSYWMGYWTWLFCTLECNEFKATIFVVVKKTESLPNEEESLGSESQLDNNYRTRQKEWLYLIKLNNYNLLSTEVTATTVVAQKAYHNTKWKKFNYEHCNLIVSQAIIDDNKEFFTFKVSVLSSLLHDSYAI